MLKLLNEEGKRVHVALSDAFCGVTGQTENLVAELSLVGEEKIRELNNSFRHIDAATDVLSFPALNLKAGEKIDKSDFPFDIYPGGGVFIGSVAVCEPRCKEQAEDYGHSFEREMNYLICHSLLHLIGYDHEEEKQKEEMRALEEAVMERLGLKR